MFTLTYLVCSIPHFLFKVPQKYACKILIRAYGEQGHDWVCPYCEPAVEEVVESSGRMVA